MPLNNAQLAAPVERAKLKTSPAASPPPPSPPAAKPRRKLSDYPSKASKPVAAATAQNLAATFEQPASPPPEAAMPVAAPPDDFPIGWELRKESWHFHRRFHAIFKRPMACGEYSHLLWQIRRRTAEHLWEDCWRVTLPNGRTLPVRGTVWRLITILPKHWQPPADATKLDDQGGS
jgi:hypothetical protein